jgi:two-component system, LytTR family, sensor kinase
LLYGCIQQSRQMTNAMYQLFRLRVGPMSRNVLLSLAMWLIIMFLLGISEAPYEIMVIWGTMGLFAIMLYVWFFQSVIPWARTKRKPFRSYLLRSFLLLVATLPPMMLLMMIPLRNIEHAYTASMLNGFFQLVITVPLLWFLYKWQQKSKDELVVLKKELGQSNANIDFLRSQINPHFLFNALNTIYGTAIQENADRTSSAVEKLGDMMRFMLHENMQEKIALTREIEYLNNYISLQRLRTDGNAGLQIEAHIEHPVTTVQIAPMLLIPFVENAFKHGISFREPSHIKISLEVRDKTLYFDVYNSKHTRPENDPEKDSNGIGLNNVQQRLQLLYPKKHDLMVRETAKDFFVHLTLLLS